MSKIKSSKFLTAILTFVCAVLIGCFVGILGGTSKSERARAAAPTITPTVTQISTYGYWASSCPPGGGAFDDMSLGNTHMTLSASGNSVSLNETAMSNQFNMGYMEFYVKVKVPALTEYTLDYDFSYGLQNTCVNASDCLGAASNPGGNCNGATIALYKLHDTDGNDESSSGILFYIDLPSAGSNKHLGYVKSCEGTKKCGNLNTDGCTQSYTFKNETTGEKEFQRKFGVSLAIYQSAMANQQKHQYNAQLSVSTTVEGQKMLAPTVTDGTTSATDTYTGSALSFGMIYNSDYVVATAVTGKDMQGNALATPIMLADIDTATRTFKPTLAGTYTVTFGLNSAATADGVTWASGVASNPTLTFTVKRKPLTVPKVTDSPKTYDPNGCKFNVDANYDSSKMTASGVGTDITWNVGNSQFEATNAGSYGVKFHLDDVNYEWDIGGGTITDQQTTVKIEPKKLTVPTITNPQEYTGSALPFALADFDGGQYIKVAAVTSANGNTATGANGAAWTDTTDVFEATEVDKYTVKLSLRDNKNYAWSDGLTADKTVDFEVTAKELLSSAPVCSETNKIGGAEWQFGNNAVTVTITDNRLSGENINLLIYWDSKSNVLTGTLSGNVTTITMPDDIPVGTHTLTVELNGTTGDNANYKITQNNTLSFEVTTGDIDPSKYGWIYTKDGAAGAAIADGDKLPFELKQGSSTNGVKYEVSIQIPASDSAKVAIDTGKYSGGYQTRSGDKVGTFKTTVALKSIDSKFTLKTSEVVINWEIEKGTFDLSGVKWEYTTDGTKWQDYDPATPPQYADGNYITVRVKSTTLPLGLSLDSLYAGSAEYDVDSYTANISASDLVYDTAKFNAPDTSKLVLNWEIAKKNLYSSFKNVKETYSNGNGTGTIIIKQLNLDPKYDGYITYKYYDESNGLPVTLEDIKNAADPTDVKKYRVEAYIDPAYSANYDVDDDGSTPSDTFETGSKNKLATVTIDGADGTAPITAEYDGKPHFDTSVIKITGEDKMNVTDFTVTYYKGNTPTVGNELASGELPKDAGEYCVAVTLGTTAEKKYILANDWFPVIIEAKKIALPTLGEITFTGGEQNIVDYLGGSYEQYKDIITLGGDYEGIRDVSDSGYSVKIKLKDTNYCWAYPETASTVKALMYSKVDYEVSSVDESTAEYKWNITPLVVDTSKMWNKGDKGATLNLPDNVKALISAGTLEVGYRYYDNEGNFIENPELKGGKQFKVDAVFGGDDSVRNVVFKTADGKIGSTAPAINYTVPKSGAATFFGNALSFFKSNWLWFLIGFLILLFLIILICVIVHRRKTKEEREAKKEAKEEEKRRKEEEREEEKRRKEEEREEEKRRREQERELEKAKAEAELAKMRAGMGLGAGAAGMAMAQQPQQMPVQQPQYVQQPVADPNALARIEAEIAAMRAEHRMQQQPQYMTQAMPQMMPMQMPMPMQTPMYGGGQQYAQPQSAGGAMSEAEMRARIAEDRMFRSAEQRAIIAEERLRSGSGSGNSNITVQPAYAPAEDNQRTVNNSKTNNADMFGAVLASMFRSLSEGKPHKKPEALPVVQTESDNVSINTPTVYPPDAVITTTTTVDTTKPKPELSRDSERNFDIDGFYDTYEGK